jgi:hypothetical protein
VIKELEGIGNGLWVHPDLQKGVDAKGAVLHLDAIGIRQEMSSWQHSGKKHKYNWAAQQQQQQQQQQN